MDIRQDVEVGKDMAERLLGVIDSEQECRGGLDIDNQASRRSGNVMEIG